MADGLMYREMHINSTFRTQGTKNRPIYQLPEELLLKKFCVRSVEVPNFAETIPRTERLTISTYNTTDLSSIVSTDFLDLGPKNYMNLFELRDDLNLILANGGHPGPPILVITDSFWLAVDPANPFTDGSSFFRFDYTGVASGVSAKYFARLLGDTEADTVSQPYTTSTAVVRNVGALKVVVNSYLLLKSTQMSGATFTPNTTFRGSFSQVDVLAKIPTNFTANPFGTYVFYTVNDAPSEDTIFSFNGYKITNLDFFFTRPDDDEVVDFQGFNFSLTLGLYTDQAP